MLSVVDTPKARTALGTKYVEWTGAEARRLFIYLLFLFLFMIIIIILLLLLSLLLLLF